MSFRGGASLGVNANFRKGGSTLSDGRPARGTIDGADSGLLARLAHTIARHRRLVIGVWIVLTLFGGFAAGQLSKRWYQSFSIPGKPAYEASQRTLKAFGLGVRP